MNINMLPQTNSNVNIACDVSKDTINLVVKFGKHCIERQIPNHSFELQKHLNQLKDFLHRCGFQRIWVVAEPTGVYHKNLLRTARRLGLCTRLVSVESVARMRVVETNDTGKTDTKDPHVIHTLASMNKTLKHRILPEPYNLLRHWNKIYDKADKEVIKAKASFRTVLKDLFPDFNKSTKFILSNSGRALMKKYQYNPYRIACSGRCRFKNVMRKQVPRIRNSTLDEIFDSAQASVLSKQSPRKVDILVIELIHCWQGLSLFLKRKGQAETAMEKLYGEAQRLDPGLPEPVRGIITPFLLSRIVAETGPLSDFKHSRKLMRYAGLNLCECKSGDYTGKAKISKKGRRLLRKVLAQVVFPLTPKGKLYGKYYHKKKETMPGTKAMIVISRHFLKVLFGVYKSGKGFEKKRMFTCESQIDLAA